MDHTRANEADESKIEIYLGIVSGVILKHMGYDEIPTSQYDETQSPPLLHPVYYDDESPSLLVVSDSVKAAVQLALSEMNENREATVADILSPAVVALLSTSFDPPFA